MRKVFDRPWKAQSGALDHHDRTEYRKAWIFSRYHLVTSREPSINSERYRGREMGDDEQLETLCVGVRAIRQSSGRGGRGRCIDPGKNLPRMIKPSFSKQTPLTRSQFPLRFRDSPVGIS